MSGVQFSATHQEALVFFILYYIVFHICLPPTIFFEYKSKFSWTGVNENFFSLGGDSITSLRIVAKSKAAGLKVHNYIDLDIEQIII